MIGIIVAGHGNFPTGIMSAVSLMAGTNLAMAVEAIFCRELMGLEELAEIIRQSAKDGVEDFDSLGNDDEMIFEDGV